MATAKNRVLKRPLPKAAQSQETPPEGPARFYNRELSWLQFNRRVLLEAQNERHPLRASEQVAVLKAVNAGLLDDVPLDAIANAEKRIQKHLLETLPELCAHMENGETLDDDQWQRVLSELEVALASIVQASGS